MSIYSVKFRDVIELNCPNGENFRKPNSSVLAIAAERLAVSETIPSTVEQKKKRTIQLGSADIDMIEMVRRKFADGVKQQSSLGNTNASDLDLLRLSLRAAMSDEISPKRLSTLMAEVRASKNSSRGSKPKP